MAERLRALAALAEDLGFLQATPSSSLFGQCTQVRHTSEIHNPTFSSRLPVLRWNPTLKLLTNSDEQDPILGVWQKA